MHRSDHFQSHGARLRNPSEAEYEAFADEFLGVPAPVGAREFGELANLAYYLAEEGKA